MVSKIMITLYVLMAITCAPVNFVTAVKNYNETCVRSDDCFDDRMVCIADEENVTRCFCNRYHRWNESIGCVQVYSVAYIMNQTVSISDNIKKLNDEQDRMFLGAHYSIFFMLFVISSCILSVFVYCCYIRKKDRRLKMIVKSLKEQRANDERRKKNADYLGLSTSQC